MSLQVIGAGFGRTGTRSLQTALQILGFDACYHMLEVMPQGPTGMQLWEQAIRGEPDWDTIFSGYKATVDFPGCTFWKQLAEYYPDARVLLSVRDPESWFQSTQETIFSPDWIKFIQTSPAAEFFSGTVKAIFDDRMHDREHLIRCFNEHIAHVQAAIPADRLLTYKVQEGWQPLCNFLQVEVPAEPFPKINDAAETRALIEFVMENGFEAVWANG